MKLYINHCQFCNIKIPLSITAANRQQLRYTYTNQFTVQCSNCHKLGLYSPSDVLAQTDSNSAVGGGVVGGLLGLVGGPLGLLIGAGIGAAVGNQDDSVDLDKVRRFNSSH